MKNSLTTVFLFITFFTACKKDMQANNDQLTNTASAAMQSVANRIPKIIVSGDKTITFLNANTGKEIYFSDDFIDSTASLSQTPLLSGNIMILFLGDHIKAVNTVTGKTVWYATLGQAATRYGYYRTSPPFITGDNIFCTSKRYNNVGKAVSNDFFNIDLRNGHINWTQPLPDFADVDLPVQVPVCTNNYAIVAVYNVLYAFDKNTGTPAWTFTRGSQFLRNPCIGNNMIFIAGDSNFGLPDSLFAIDAASGTLKWKRGYGSYDAFGYNAAPAYANGSIFINLSDGISCVDATSGNLVWQTNTAQSLSPLFIDAGKIYATSPYNNIVFSINTADGSINWRTTISNQFVLANLNEGAAVLNDVVLVRNFAYHGVDKETGKEVWSTPLNNGLNGNPPFIPCLTDNTSQPVFYGASGMR